MMKFTRASTAQVLSADDATYASVASGVPRFSGSAQRLVIHEARTNAIRNPRWEGAVAGSPGTVPTYMQRTNSTNISLTIAGTGTEFGMPYLDVAVAGTAGASTEYPYISLETAQQIGATVGQVVAAGYFARIVSGTFPAGCTLRMDGFENNSSGLFIASTAAITMSTPTASLAWLGGTVTMAQAAVAYYVPAPTIRVAAGTATGFTIRLYSPAVNVNVASGITLPPPGLPVAGTPAAFAQAAEVVTMAGAAHPSAGTLLLRGWVREQSSGSSSRPLVSVDDGSLANAILVQINAASLSVRAFPRLAGASGSVAIGGNVTAGAEFNLGVSWGAGVVAISLNGAAAVTTTQTLPTNLTTLRLGCNSSAAYANAEFAVANYAPGLIVPPAQLQAMTAALT
jgi:hypothetical protein